LLFAIVVYFLIVCNLVLSFCSFDDAKIPLIENVTKKI